MPLLLYSGAGAGLQASFVPEPVSPQVLHFAKASPAAMIRKRTATFIVAGVAAVVLSSVVAYRLGLRHAAVTKSLRDQVQAPAGDCVDIQNAGRHTGENSCVEGRVLRVFTSRSGSTFLDFCQNYQNCPFTSVIFATDRSHFGNLGSLEGRRVQISGEITTYNGRAEIIIRDPKQIRARN